MEKMTDDDFRSNLDVLMKVLEKQPELFKTASTSAPRALQGEHLAEMVFAFVEKFQELYKQKVS